MKSSVSQPIIDQFKRYWPFDRIPEKHLTWLAGRIERVKFVEGEIILLPVAGSGEFYFISSGTVQMEALGSLPDHLRVLAELTEGECFPVEALEQERMVFSTFRAKVDTECFCLSKHDFVDFKALDEIFADFCRFRSVNFLEQSRRVYKLHYSHQSEEQHRLNTPLSLLMDPHPLTARADITVRDIVAPMYEQDKDATVIVDEENRPIGIFTMRDLLHKVVIPGGKFNIPVEQVMTPAPKTMPASSMGYEASMLLAKSAFHHVVLVNNGILAGIVKDQDLYSIQRVSLSQLSAQIRIAENIEQLKECHRDIRLLSENMLAQGVKAEQMTQIISSLNDQIVSRTIELEFPSDEVEQFEICWVALGSEGRHEQTLTTDQDNGIIFKAPEGMSNDSAREILLPLARKVNLALAEIGIPLCDGDVMAMHPKCCMSYTEWQVRFVKWISEPSPDSLLNAKIFFDFRYICGDVKLSDRLRVWLSDAVKDGGMFYHLMVENALEYKPQLGFFRDFNVEDHPDCPQSIDIKAHGVNLFVDAARIYALAHGVTRSNTRKRLQIVGDHRKWPQSEVNAWVDAFTFLQSLRIRSHMDQYQNGKKPHNRINPYALNKLDQKVFLEALRQAGRLQKQLIADFSQRTM